MSDLKHLAIAEVVYFTVIYGLQAYLRKPVPEKAGDAKQKDSSIFKFSLCLHNAILCILSLAMFLGAGYEAWIRSRFMIWMHCHAACDLLTHECVLAAEWMDSNGSFAKPLDAQQRLVSVFMSLAFYDRDRVTTS